MLARIYQPARTATQSGPANSRQWVLEFAPEQRKRVEPLMGWVGSGDMNRQVVLHFDSREEAMTYAERHGIPYQLFEPKTRRPVLRPGGYGDNFSSQRRFPWSH